MHSVGDTAAMQRGRARSPMMVENFGVVFQPSTCVVCMSLMRSLLSISRKNLLRASINMLISTLVPRNLEGFFFISRIELRAPADRNKLTLEILRLDPKQLLPLAPAEVTFPTNSAIDKNPFKRKHCFGNGRNKNTNST